MQPLKITFTDKYLFPEQQFKFNFPVEYTEHHQMTQQQLETLVHHQDVLMVSELEVNQQVLEHNPDLKLLALCSTGYNHVDLELMQRHGVKVCNIRGQATDAVAEHAFTLMINLIKNFPAQCQAVEQGKWSGEASFYLAAPMRELKGKTLAILGKGTIGSSLAEKARAFGMQVIFSEHKQVTTCREGYVPFQQAIAQADVVSLHCVLNVETEQMMDLAVFQQMKPNAILINAGRGGLVNNQDVITALEQGLLAGYGADVLDQEPPPADHPLLNVQRPNVIITAHIAWATDEAQQRLFDMLQDNVNQNMQGTAQNLVGFVR